MRNHNMLCSMSRSSAQTSSQDFREIDRRIEKLSVVFKYNSPCTNFKIFEFTHIADVFVLFWGNPKTLTPGPRTPTTDRVHGLPTDRSTDYPYGPPLRTTPKIE